MVDEIVVRFEDAVRQPQGDLLWADLNCSEVEVLQAPLYARGTSDMRINKQRAHPAMASGGKDDCSNKMTGSGAGGKKARFCCAFRQITDLDLLRILIPEQRC